MIPKQILRFLMKKNSIWIILVCMQLLGIILNAHSITNNLSELP